MELLVKIWFTLISLSLAFGYGFHCLGSHRLYNGKSNDVHFKISSTSMMFSIVLLLFGLMYCIWFKD
jgi:hypothetical protein